MSLLVASRVGAQAFLPQSPPPQSSGATLARFLPGSLDTAIVPTKPDTAPWAPTSLAWGAGVEGLLGLSVSENRDSGWPYT